MERHQRNAHLTEEDKRLDELERYEVIANYYMDNPHRMVAKNNQYLLDIINRQYEIEPSNFLPNSIKWCVLLHRLKKLKK